MSSVRKNREILREVLAEVYRRKRPALVDEKWREGVLRSVRLISSSGDKPNHGVDKGFKNNFYQLAPAAGVVLTILFLITVAFIIGTGNEPDLIAMDDPLEVVVAQLFWL